MATERSCPNCGAAVMESDSFCGTCGEFLAWEVTPAPPLAEQVTRDPPPVQRPSDRPGAVLPGRAAAARPVVREFTDEPARADDVSCSACGTPNRQGRRFCRRCGTPLRPPGPAAVEHPWWRRLRPPRIRLGFLQVLWRLLLVLVVVALAVTGGYLIMKFGPGAVETVRDRLAEPEQIHPAAVTASSEEPGHGASEAVDGLSNRYWAPAAPGQAAGQFLEMTFDRPFRLLDIIVYTGVSSQQEQFVQQGRPAVLDLTAWTSTGTVTTTTLRLADRPGEQRFHHAVGSVVRLRFTIRSSYGAGDGLRSALAEVELFRRP